MKVAVVDASAFIDFLLHGPRVAEVQVEMTDPDRDIHVPALCDVEVVAALRRGMQAGALDEAPAFQALRSYLDYPLTKHGHGPLLARALTLRANFTAYDATYVALAELLGAALLTTDDRLARAARRHTALEVLPAR